MKKTTHRLANSDAAISASSIEKWAHGWLLDSDIRQLADTTIRNRKLLVDKFLWFLRDREYADCDTTVLKEFLAYMGNGHKEDRGRWGNKHLTRQVRPRTVATHYGNLRTMFRYFIEEGYIDESPLEAIKPPVFRRDQVQPFTNEQIEAILHAACRSRHRRRDEAIVLFLLDTGVRASELCEIRMRELDMQGRRCTVLGKGNKHRSVFFGKATAKALWQYLQENQRDDNDCVFASDRGITAGDGLTRDGLLQLVHRLGRAARLKSIRCSPHTFRHTFSVEFLRAGGNVFTLKELLGHTSLAMVNRYVALAQADIENQHRQFSPADRLRARTR